MTLTIEISDELQARLARQAEARGKDIATLAAEFIEQASRETVSFDEKPYDSARLHQFLADMAQFSDKIPDLPDEALSRESIYRDHD